MGEADEAVWAEHEAAVQGILERFGKALQGAEHPGMTYPSFRAELSRRQIATAEKLGKTKDDLKEKFEPEAKKLKDMSGL